MSSIEGMKGQAVDGQCTLGGVALGLKGAVDGGRTKQNIEAITKMEMAGSHNERTSSHATAPLGLYLAHRLQGKRKCC